MTLTLLCQVQRDKGHGFSFGYNPDSHLIAIGITKKVITRTT